MEVRREFNGNRLAVGGFLLALGAGVGSQLPEAVPVYAVFFRWLGIALLAAGALISVFAFLDISLSGGRVYPIWRQDLIDRALRNAPSTSTISLLQTSFPNAADLVPFLKELLVSTDKRFKFRLLLMNPFTVAGKSIIAARVRLRDQTPAHHESEIEDHIEQFMNMKAEVDRAWKETRDGAKLSLEIRLYDHLPFGPQYHIGDESFVGFFVAKHSSIRAPMLRLRRLNGKSWKSFREDFEDVWKAAEPYKP